MNTQAIKHLHRPLLVGGIAAILVGGIAIGTLAISAQGSNGIPAAVDPTQAATAPLIAPRYARPYRCAECGVIESTRKIEAADETSGVNAPGRIAGGNQGKIEENPVRSYEITIRLRDGSMHVITDTNPARWRPGERVQLIAGLD